MYYTITLPSTKKTIQYYLTDNNKVSEYKEIDKKTYTFFHSGEQNELVDDLVKLGFGFIMFGSTEETYYFFKNTTDGLESEQYPIIEGIIKYHYDIVYESMLKDAEVQSKEDLKQNAYFEHLTDKDKETLLSIACD